MSEKKPLIEVVPANYLEPPKGNLLFHEAEPLVVGNLQGVQVEGQEEVRAARRKALDAEHAEFLRKVAAGEVERPKMVEDAAESPAEG